MPVLPIASLSMLRFYVCVAGTVTPAGGAEEGNSVDDTPYQGTLDSCRTADYLNTTCRPHYDGEWENDHTKFPALFDHTQVCVHVIELCIVCL